MASALEEDEKNRIGIKNHSEDYYQKTGIKSRKDFISKTSKLDQEPECLNIDEERADVKKLFQGPASISKGNHQPAPNRRALKIPNSTPFSLSHAHGHHSHRKYKPGVATE